MQHFKPLKIQIGLALALLVSLSSQAAVPLSEAELAKRLKFYASISTLSVGFKQIKTLKDLGMQLKSEGRLKLERPDKITWEITKPSPLVVNLDKNEIRIRSGVGADERVQTLKMSEASADQPTQSLTGLIAWLNLDSKALSEQYQVSATDKQSFHFEPKQKESVPFQSLDMSLGVDGQLKHLTLHELSGDSLEIEFGKPQITRL